MLAVGNVAMLSRRREARRVYRNPRTVPVAVLAVALASFLILPSILSSASTDLMIFGLIMLAMIIAVNARVVWAAVTDCDEGIHVANFFTSYTLAWNESERFDLGQYWLLPNVCLIYTIAGERKGATAVHGGGVPASGSGKEAVEELNRELAQEREGQGGPASRSANFDGIVSTS